MMAETMSDDMMAADAYGPRDHRPAQPYHVIAFTGPMGSGDYIGISEADADDVLSDHPCGQQLAALPSDRAACRRPL